MKCPNCQTENDASYRFCMSCGFELHAPSPPVPEPAPASLTGGSAWGDDALTTAPPSTVSVPPPIKPEVINFLREAPYGESGRSPLNPWGPFAGYGTRRRHVSWLMDSQGHRAPELVALVNQKFQERKIPGAGVFRRTLTAQGVLPENRPYFILQRGLVSLALYINQFGQDLFISMASYLKPPISPLRVLILGIMVFFQLFMYSVYPSKVNQAVNEMVNSLGLFGSGGGGGGALASLLCIVGPLGFVNTIALMLFVLYSLYKFITEKDILAGLRMQPNEFDEDNLMALEKAVEQTVRISLTDLRLNPDDLRVAIPGRGGQLF